MITVGTDGRGLVVIRTDFVNHFLNPEEADFIASVLVKCSAKARNEEEKFTELYYEIM